MSFIISGTKNIQSSNNSLPMQQITLEGDQGAQLAPKVLQQEQLALSEQLQSRLSFQKTDSKSSIGDWDPEDGEQGGMNETEESKYFLDVNRDSVTFGANPLYPGFVEECEIVVSLKRDFLDQGMNYQILARTLCLNQQLNDHDEYVFSVREAHNLQYQEAIRTKLKGRQLMRFYVALKVPPIKQDTEIEGSIEIHLQNLDPLIIPLKAKCQIPQITCNKELFRPYEQVQVIRVAAKKNQSKIPPIPFRNLSGYGFVFEVELLGLKTQTIRPYDVVVGSSVTCPPSGQFFINLQLKIHPQLKNQAPNKDLLRKILMLKIRGSTLTYNYPLECWQQCELMTNGVESFVRKQNYWAKIIKAF